MPEQFHGRRTLTGYSPGIAQLDTTDHLSLSEDEMGVAEPRRLGGEFHAEETACGKAVSQAGDQHVRGAQKMPVRPEHKDWGLR